MFISFRWLSMPFYNVGRLFLDCLKRNVDNAEVSSRTMNTP
jgi:hypothetical protein